MKTKLTIILSALVLVQRTAYSQTQFYDATEIDNFSSTPIAEAVPLNPYSGNAARVVRDLSVAAASEVGLDWTRYYNTGYDNTQSIIDTARLSPGWSHSFNWVLFDISFSGIAERMIEVIYPDGNIKGFYGWTKYFYCPRDADYVLVTNTSYTLVTANNERVTWPRSNGLPSNYASSVTDSKGNATTLTYTTISNTPVLSKVTDPSGHYLQMSYTLIGNKPYITSVATSDGRSVAYSYTNIAAPNATSYALTSANYPDGTAAAYSYNYTAKLPIMATARDVRADGIPSIRYGYAPVSKTGLPGFVTNVWNNSDQSLIVQSTSNANGGTPTSATLTYPDGRIYNYSLSSPDGLKTTTYTATNSTSGTTTYKYALPPYDPPNGNYDGYYKKSGTIKTTDAKGNLWTEIRNMRGGLLSRTAPDGAVATFIYDAGGYLTSSTDENGHATTYTRDPTREWVTSVNYPDGTRESFTYNSFGYVLTHTRRNGGIENFAYSVDGLLLTHKTATGQTTTYTYNSNYRVASIADGLGHTTSFQYNDRGLVTKATYAEGSFKTFVYDNLGNLLQATNELGNSAWYSYDSLNRMISTTDPLSRKTSFSFDPNTPSNGSPILVTFPSGRQMAATYQAAFAYQVSSITQAYGTPAASTSSQAFDILGNVTSATPPTGNPITFQYDSRNRKTRTTDPAGNITTFAYDRLGNLLTQTNSNGTTTNTYDTLNRLLKTVFPPSNPTAYPDPVTVSYTYDAEGSVKTYTDPNSNSYQYVYDLDQRQIKYTYPDTSSQQMTYDAASNLQTLTTRDGRIKTLSYDSRSRCTGYTWNDSVTPSANTSYDAASRPVSTANINGTTSYAYDAANELITDTQNVSGLGSKIVRYGYSQNAEIATMTYPDGTVIGYQRNALGNVTDILLGGIDGTPIAHYDYDLSGNRTIKNLANGVNSALAYDPAQRLTSIIDTVGGSTLQGFNYGYDGLNRLKYVKRANGLGDVYAYDTRNQLMGVQYNATNPDTAPTNPSRTVNYLFDAAGNRTQTVDTAAGTTNYLSNSNNQYTSVGGNPLSYDNRGNVTGFSGAAYLYDAENELLQASNTFFAYDAYGRCVKRTDSSGTAYLIYGQGWNLIAEYNVSGIQQARYVQGTNIDEILTRTDSSGVTIYYDTDRLGSITKLTSSTGHVLEQYTYDAYGSPSMQDGNGASITASSFGNRFLFTGREYLSSLNLYDYRNRQYSPTLGRFLQPDPVDHSGDLFNLYRFCGNNPVNNTDPSGLDDIFGPPPDEYVFIEIDPGYTYVARWDDNGNYYGAWSATGADGTTYQWYVSYTPGATNSEGVQVIPGATASDCRTIPAPATQVASAPQPSGPPPPSNSTAATGSSSASPASQAGSWIEAADLALTIEAFGDTIGEHHYVNNGLWRGTNGQWHRLGWGGNGATGARGIATINAKIFHGFGEGVFWASTGVAVYRVIQDPSLPNASHQALNVSMARVGMAWPWGTAASAVYFTGNAIGWDKVGAFGADAYRASMEANEVNLRVTGQGIFHYLP
jgi:RHS repeat-associated protein